VTRSQTRFLASSLLSLPPSLSPQSLRPALSHSVFSVAFLLSLPRYALPSLFRALTLTQAFTLCLCLCLCPHPRTTATTTTLSLNPASPPSPNPPSLCSYPPFLLLLRAVTRSNAQSLDPSFSPSLPISSTHPPTQAPLPSRGMGWELWVTPPRGNERWAEGSRKSGTRGRACREAAEKVEAPPAGGETRREPRRRARAGGGRAKIRPDHGGRVEQVQVVEEVVACPSKRVRAAGAQNVGARLRAANVAEPGSGGGGASAVGRWPPAAESRAAGGSGGRGGRA
jgi:hypothetical protein